MAQPTAPKSYDEITRTTVPEPDSSYRPSKNQERAAFDGERIVSPEEASLHRKVTTALHSSGLDVSAVTVEIDDTRVTLRGRVSDVSLLPRLDQAVHAVPGVGEVVDLVVIPAGT
jgi:hypothetical protein